MQNIDDSLSPRRRVLLATGLAGSAALAAAGLFHSRPAAAQGFLQASSLLEILQHSRELTLFHGWVKQAGLERELAAPGNVALFVPHDGAIMSLTAQQLGAIEQNRETLTRTIRAHLADYPHQILAGGTDRDNSNGANEAVRSRAGSTIFISNPGGSLPRVNSFAIFVSNMRAANGIAHCIDGVLRA